jgi:polysaccharide pyruvyl transferase WcaK-like protein
VIGFMGTEQSMLAARLELRQVLVAAVPHSENLGDQVIADCTAYLISKLAPGVEINHLDFAGRTTRDDESVFRGSRLLSVFLSFPAWVRPLGVLTVLPSVLLVRHGRTWSEAIRGADAIIVGGGQLLQDVDLNFPVKLALFGSLVAKRRKYFTLFAVGVDDSGSWLGRVLLKRFLLRGRMRHASCRDELSRAALVRLAGGEVSPPELAPDPALFASEIYEPAALERGLIGINVASPQELASAAFEPKYFSIDSLSSLWLSLIAALSERGNRILLFTNGSRTDQRFAQRIGDLAGPSSAIRVAPRPTSPLELVRLITSCEGLIAHRLHACILGTAYGRKVVPLTWDKKVPAFFSLFGESNKCIAPASATADRIIATLEDPVPASRGAELNKLRLQTLRVLEKAL